MVTAGALLSINLAVKMEQYLHSTEIFDEMTKKQERRQKKQDVLKYISLGAAVVRRLSGRST
jgi:hypothetical protein